MTNSLLPWFYEDGLDLGCLCRNKNPKVLYLIEKRLDKMDEDCWTDLAKQKYARDFIKAHKDIIPYEVFRKFEKQQEKERMVMIQSLYLLKEELDLPRGFEDFAIMHLYDEGEFSIKQQEEKINEDALSLLENHIDKITTIDWLILEDRHINKNFNFKHYKHREYVLKHVPEYILRKVELTEDKYLMKDVTHYTELYSDKSCGKCFILARSMEPNKRYLILVPFIVLLEQLKNEFVQFDASLSDHIQLIGDSSNVYEPDKHIVLCVYNSIHLLSDQIDNFDRIVIDETL